jgi:hypothetical protein
MKKLAAFLPVTAVLSFSLPALAQLQPPAPMGQPQPAPTAPSPGVPGLAPPPPMTPGAGPGDPGASETKKQLDAAEKEDSGRNFELFWLNADVGGGYINMRQFSADTLAIEKSDGAGPLGSVGLGVRLVLLSLGARMRYNAFSAFKMWQANAEVALKIPISSIDLLVGLHGGWAWLGSLGSGSLSTSTSRSASDVSVSGFNGGLDLGFDYYITPLFSLGLAANGDFLYLKRPPVPIPSGLPAEQEAAIKADPLYQNSGTGVGFGIGTALRLGFHFGI